MEQRAAWAPLAPATQRARARCTARGAARLLLAHACPLCCHVQENARRQGAGQAPLSLRKPSAYFYIEGAFAGTAQLLPAWWRLQAQGACCRRLLSGSRCASPARSDWFLRNPPTHPPAHPPTHPLLVCFRRPACRHLLQRHEADGSSGLLRAHTAVQQVGAGRRPVVGGGCGRWKRRAGRRWETLGGWFGGKVALRGRSPCPSQSVGCVPSQSQLLLLQGARH